MIPPHILGCAAREEDKGRAILTARKAKKMAKWLKYADEDLGKLQYKLLKNCPYEEMEKRKGYYAGVEKAIKEIANEIRERVMNEDKRGNVKNRR